ncbi:MAG: HTH domain-containing protein [Flavobacteriaceae bacterium]|nr:HTH domain-containing protein [Flavobacteriaceae bacterium]
MSNCKNNIKNNKELERLRKIHCQIKASNTGTPQEFAESIGISRSQIYNIIDNLKIKGFPICYSKTSKSFFYEYKCELEIEYSVRLLTKGETIDISGGSCFDYDFLISNY